MADFRWTAGDTQPSFTDMLQNPDDTPVNLTGATVRFTLRQVGATNPLTLTGITTILNAVAGEVAFTPSAQDTATPGLYQASWFVTFPSGGGTKTFGERWGEIEASLRTPGVAPPVDELIRPSSDQLGAFMRARTVKEGTGGNELGVFTTETRPTVVEAEGMIDQAVQAVLMQTGPLLPARLIPQARFLVLVHAAQLVELTFFRNEVVRSQSAYEQYRDLFQTGIQALRASVADDDPASPEAPFWSVPILSARQAHWQAMFAAFNPTTGQFDPSLLPVEEFFPAGFGGVPAGLLAVWPWLFGEEGPLDTGLAFLED